MVGGKPAAATRGDGVEILNAQREAVPEFPPNHAIAANNITVGRDHRIATSSPGLCAIAAAE
jgi:hypothetical protein